MKFELVEKRVDGKAYRSSDGMTVIVSSSIEKDGKEWKHVSFARKNRMPSYQDMALVKAIFIGEEFDACMVLPKKEKHVNIHNFCLHLFTTKEWPLPDFTQGTGSI
ncbi:MAG: hypothetical protein WCR33_03600 [Bacilli bacterium]